MLSNRLLKLFVPICLSLLLFVTGCASKATSRYSQIQKETTRRGASAAVVKQAEQGGTFNKYFPGSTGTYEVVPAQEKQGFAEYKLNQDGKTVALLSISDTLSLPTAAVKYQSSTQKIAGYPAVDQGMLATGLLVNDRYQVKVLSRDSSFTKDDRVAWLQKFDLRQLAKLEGMSTAKVPALLNTDKAPALPNAKANKPQLNPVPQQRPVLNPQPAT